MPSFVSTIVTEMSSTTVAFAVAVVSTYWMTILGVGFVGFIAYKFLRLAHLR